MENKDLPASHMILMQITSSSNSFTSERRFDANIKISELKSKLELITGASSLMQLQLFADNQLIASIDDNERTLISYLGHKNATNFRIHVTDRSVKSGEFDDLNQVKKMELSQHEYETRADSLLAFKKQHKLGRFSDNQKDKEMQIDSNEVKVGDRCEVCVRGNIPRRGTVLYVGETHFKPGQWVGIRLDEPLGKNDGSIDGKRYFECKPKYGTFVRPSDCHVGDFPEIELDLDEI